MRERALCVLAALSLLAPAAQAQQQFLLNREQDQGPVEILADSISTRGMGSVITGNGNVVLTWQGYRLQGESASFTRDSSVAEAEGNVVLEDPDGNVLRCKHLTVNVETQEGSVEDGSLWIARDGYRVWGKRFRKTGPVSYEVEDGGFTACDGTWPSWRVNARRIEVQLEGYLKAHRAAFWVEGVPVVYTPYLVFPVKRQRQSGFLLPRVGMSSRDGVIVGTRYFWAFSDSADLTARLEYRSKRGWFEAAELRYALAEGHGGTAEVSHIWDRKDEEHRYTVRADHLSRFDEVTRAKLHVDYLGDRNLLQDLGDTIDQRGVARKENFLLATRDQDPGTVYGLAKYVQALQEPQGGVLQTLPEVGLEGRETPLLGPLSGSPSARFTNYYRADGEEGQRIELGPGLAWDTRAGGVGLGLRGGYRENLYRVDGDLVSRGALSASAVASAAFARPYAGGLLHTIEPKLAWTWQEEGRGPKPPQFDPTDVFEKGAAVGFRLESRLLRASDLSALAGIDLERDLDLGRLRDQGWGERAFDPWRARLTVTPGDALQLRAEIELDPAQADPVLHWFAQGHAKDSRGDRLFGSYSFLKGSASYLDAGLEIPIIAALSVQYRDRYSFRDERSLERGVGLHLMHQCWEVLATMSRNFREDETGYENRYFVTLQLKGLGKLGVLRGIMP